MPLRRKTPQKWEQKGFWFRLNEPTDKGKLFEQVMVYMTGNGDNSQQPYVRHGKTFFIKAGDDLIRQQIELDVTKLQKHDVWKFNLDSGEFDIPCVEKL